MARAGRLLCALTRPGMALEDAELWRETPLAHRGLAGPGAPGNSIAAFERAVEAGFGVELDARLCRDGLVVLHDGRVDCPGGARRARGMTRAELRAALGAEAAPELAQALCAIAGRAPVAIELKTDGARGAYALARAAAAQLSGYAGPYCVLAFNPLALGALGRLLPDAPRGQLVARPAEMRRWCGALLGALLANLALNRASRPALAAIQAGADSPGISAWRRQGGPCAAWTLTTEGQLRRARARGDVAIFEGEEARAAAERLFAGRWAALDRWRRARDGER